MNILKRFWDLYSDKIGQTIFHPQFYAKVYAWDAVILTRRKSSGTLLDIGCGRMPYKKFLMPKIKKYIGLDHPETAKMYIGDEKPDIFADATQIPLKDRSVDTVIMLMLIEHLPNPLAALIEARRVLKKNGHIVLSTVQMYPIHDEPFDYLRYTKWGLKDLFQQAGFTSISVTPQGNFWSFWGLSLNVYLFKKLLNLSRNKSTIWIAFILAIPFYIISIASNLVFYIPAKLENPKTSRFNISHVVSAK